MKITHREGIFIAISTYEEKDALKSAGFLWHSPAECKYSESCLACKARVGRGWWTKRSESAARLQAFADDFALRALSAHIEAVESSRAMDAEIEIPCPKNLTFFGYQKAGIKYLAAKPAVLLADEMGVGKTPQSLGLINYDETINQILVICPASIRLNWEREANRWLVRENRIEVVTSQKPPSPRSNFVIVNYDKLIPRFEECPSCDGDRDRMFPCQDCHGTGNGPVAQYLCTVCGGKKEIRCASCNGRGKLKKENPLYESIAARQWDLIICDEAHYLKSIDSLRTKTILGNYRKNIPGLVKQSKRRVFLTGTPLMNKPIEMWPILASCAPVEFGDFARFAKRYCDAHEEYIGKKKVWKMDGASNLEELQERVRASCMIRRLKKDVLADLPPKMRQIIPLPIGETRVQKIVDEEMTEWETKYSSDIEILSEQLKLAEDEKDVSGYDAAVKRLEYIQRTAFIEMAKTRHRVAIAKLPYVIKHIEEILDDGVEKLVVFAHHHDVIEGIKAAFEKSSVMLYGPMKVEDRQRSVDRFMEDPKVKLFVGSIQAAGVGLTLTAASMVLFAELDWVPANLTQAEDRLHRIGQVNSVLVRHLVWDGSLDARMCQLVVEKQEIADRALDRSTDVAVKGIVNAKPEIPVEPIPAYEKTVLKEAMIYLAQSSGGGGSGFNAMDGTLGQKFATWQGELSDRQAHVARKFARKYRRQLPEYIAKHLGIWEPVKVKPKKGKSAVDILSS